MQTYEVQLPTKEKPSVFRETIGTIKSGYRAYLEIIKKVPKKHTLPLNGHDKEAEYNRIINRILQITADGIVNRSGGVELDGLGYFCNWMTPEPALHTHRVMGQLRTNLTTGRYWYNTALFTFTNRINYFAGWYMESAFTKPIVNGIYKEIKAGRKYTIHVELLKSLNKVTTNYYRKNQERQRKVNKHDNKTTDK